MKKVTLKDIAQESGVSIMTVCYILNGRDKLFRPQTRQTVLATAARLGYKPNAAAKAVLTGRFGCVALLFAENAICSELPTPLLSGIQDELELHDLHLVLSRFAAQEGSDRQAVPKVLRQALADGLLVYAPRDLPQPLEEQLALPQPPLVWIGRERPTDAVYADLRAAAAKAVQELASRGHRRIPFLYPATDPTDKVQHCQLQPRLEGYQAAMAAAGLTPQPVELPADNGGWMEPCQRLLATSERPTALLTLCEMVADVAMFAAAKAGLSVPGDLSLMALLAPEWTVGGQALAAMEDPQHEVGRRAAQMLLQKIKQPQEPIPAAAIPCQFLAGETIGPAPAG
ncbi:MAG: LacI family DNA-binding transcriptional regulator [Lentisphaeria bacterium]|jgi:LacI family transcriptional regulator